MADVPVSVMEQIDQLRTQGNECMQKKHFLQAVDFYTQCIRVVPLHLPKKSAVCYANRALARLQTNDKQLLSAALLDARVAVELDPTYNKAHYRLSQAIIRFVRVLQAHKTALESKMTLMFTGLNRPLRCCESKGFWKSRRELYKTASC